MSRQILKTVTRTQGVNAAVTDGTVLPVGFEFGFVDVPVLAQAFRRMVRTLEFDVCEMALTTYLCAREHNIRFTALPIFLVRAFHHGAIVCNTNKCVREPKDLEGQRVGVNRGYTVTTGVWARSVLQDEYGVNLSKITWVLSGDEHVEAYEPPPNVMSIESGETIEGLLGTGEIAAAVNIPTDNTEFQPLITNPQDKGIAAFRRDGHYPINHLVVVRDDVLDAFPDVAVSVFNAFAAAKHMYLEKLGEGLINQPTSADKLYARMLEMGSDPLPYGVEPNRGVLESLVAHATTQQILRKPVEIESLFVPSTLELIA